MLIVENLSVDYFRRGQIIHAVQNVSLSIGIGEAVGLVGESGSGKSTIALAILRLIGTHEGRITSGRIHLDGMDLLALSEPAMREIRGRRISMIFQDPFTSLNPVMKIREQMAEVFEAHAMPRQPGDLDEALTRVQLEPGRMLDAYPHQLSGGQRQRIMIAIALLGRPELILADEPTTALDVLVQKDILTLLFGLQKKLSFGMLFISHNLGLVMTYTHRTAVIKAGVLVEEGPSHLLGRQPSNPYTRQLIEAIPRIKR